MQVLLILGPFVVLGLIAFCVAVGFGVLVPVLPVFARSFGVGNLQVGAVISAFALMRLVSSPVCGKLIDLWGERIVMATGIFIVAISSSVIVEKVFNIPGIGTQANTSAGRGDLPVVLGIVLVTVVLVVVVNLLVDLAQGWINPKVRVS